MGANFSLIIVRILRKQRRTSRMQNEQMVLRNEKHYCWNVEEVDDTVLSSTRRDVKDSTVLLEDESGVCSMIVFGTSNENFLKHRHQKIVSTVEI